MTENNETGLEQIGNEYRMLVPTGKGDADSLPITKKQFTFLNRYILSGDLERCANEVGIVRETAMDWLRQPSFQQYIHEQYQRAGAKMGCTAEWALLELRNLWYGKTEKNAIQMNAMKEINRMQGHIKEGRGNINAREFINAEYVVIQKSSASGIGPEPARLAGAGGSIPSQVQLSDVRPSMGQNHTPGLGAVQINGETVLNSMVYDQPAQTRQGHDLEQTSSDDRASQKQFPDL